MNEKTILERVTDVMYDPDTSLVYRLRDGLEPMTSDERKVLMEFANSVKQHLEDNSIKRDEVIMCLQILFIFQTYDEMENFVVEFYQTIVD